MVTDLARQPRVLRHKDVSRTLLRLRIRRNLRRRDLRLGFPPTIAPLKVQTNRDGPLTRHGSEHDPGPWVLDPRS